jgi:NAD(P)-dependent dehydrogenase (short-subunit alcohol dehydrogenase family)
MMSLAIERGPHGIRVMAILPFTSEGERTRALIAARAETAAVGVDAVSEQCLDGVSLRHMVTDDEVAALALFPCSPAAGNLTGQAVTVGGNLESG